MISQAPTTSDSPPPTARQAARPLILVATLVSLFALAFYGYGTRVVIDRLIEEEGAQIGEQWTLAYAYMLEARADFGERKELSPYGRTLTPELLKPLDSAIFNSEILGYRIYSLNGTVVASSSFEEIGAPGSNTDLDKAYLEGQAQSHLTHETLEGAAHSISTAVAPPDRQRPRDRSA